MSKHHFRRSLGFLLSALLAVSALPVTALAAETENAEFQTIQLQGTDVTLDETRFDYTGSPITPNVTVRVEGELLTLDRHYTLEYRDNTEVGEAAAIVTGIATAGYTGTVEHPFYIEEKAPEFTLVEIQGTDVLINGTSFPYTGEPVEPAVTVTIEGKTLTPEQDYTVEYVNNLLPGTGTVIVRGIATASETLGYTGEVRIDFTIQPIPQEPEEDQSPQEPPVPDEKPEEKPLTEIRPGDVTINGKEFVHTGKPIEPEITVTVDGKVLTAGKDYSLTYEDNTAVGSGKAVVTGLEAAGFTGTVEVRFTIRPITAEEYPLTELRSENVTLEGTRFVYTGKPIEPKLTVTAEGKVLVAGKDYSVRYENNVSVGTATVTVSGIATATETGGYTGTVKLNFTIFSGYQLTKGNGGRWFRESSKDLSFAADGPFAEFTGVSVDGRKLDAADFTAKDGTVVTLKSSFLKKLGLGYHSLTLHFSGTDATGSFYILEGLDSTNPQTGDTFPLHALTAVLFISLTGLIGAAYAWHKKLWK
ncbi:MAG: hypothetical protein IJD98_07955 [Oscillospiraceae bacterium]|nr:hypothetical protein [Oscillospiraceae bacterium]